MFIIIYTKRPSNTCWCGCCCCCSYNTYLIWYCGMFLCVCAMIWRFHTIRTSVCPHVCVVLCVGQMNCFRFFLIYVRISHGFSMILCLHCWVWYIRKIGNYKWINWISRQSMVICKQRILHWWGKSSLLDFSL